MTFFSWKETISGIMREHEYVPGTYHILCTKKRITTVKDLGQTGNLLKYYTYRTVRTYDEIIQTKPFDTVQFVLYRYCAIP